MNYADYLPIRSGSLTTSDREQQLTREKTLFLYSQALERGDLDLVGTILREAETDEVLERMIFDLGNSIEGEYFGPQAASYGTSGGMPGWILDGLLSRSNPAEPVEVDLVPAARHEGQVDSQAFSEIEERAEELFRFALDHAQARRYLEAEKFLGQALDLALFINDPLAVAECAFLFAEIEEDLGYDPYARAFCRLGLTTLDVGLVSSLKSPGMEYSC